LGSQAGHTSRWPVVLLFSQLVFRLLLPHLPRIKGRRRMRGFWFIECASSIGVVCAGAFCPSTGAFRSSI
jgi:hypothetical protein